jgi:MarR family transcriptional regulator, temperature-dependent positive regulator of motility
MSSSLLSLLHRVNQIATENFTSAMGDSDLTPRQVQVLAAIEAHEGSSQTRIVELTGVDRSTLADIIKRLLRNKLIERKRSKEDARAYVVKISEAGRQALAVGKPALATVEKGLLPSKARAAPW